MSTKRHCDCCGQPFTPWPKRITAKLLGSEEERYVGRVTVDVLSATGREDVCVPCVIRAVSQELESLACTY